MFRFADREYFWAFLLIALLIVLFAVMRIFRRRAMLRFMSAGMWKELAPDVSDRRPYMKFVLWVLALAAIVLALARPQFGSKMITEKRRGVELIIALDVSNSMMAEDIQPNRLERAKRAINQLVDNLSDDQIGLIVFAGNAYTQLPITSDYSSAKLFLSAISTGMMPRQGTAIGAAINLATNSFNPQFTGNKAIIVITDGENHEDDAVGMATAAAEKGIVVHTIGMGLPEGAPIPIVENGSKGYMKDKKGEVVITRLDENMLQQIAAAGKGVYVRANNAQVGLTTLFSEINKMEDAELLAESYAEYNDIYQWFLALATALILLDFLLLERKNKYLKNINLFE
ncbi:MAG: VWA domain-containing protein [Bacteroidales bacterium]|nr:VWA domain-containing protein [Bacteroidales bacterium]